MNALRLMMGIMMTLTLIASGQAEEKKVENKKLVGVWEVVKSEEGAPPVGTVLEFAKDGKVKITHKKDDQDVTVEGKYSVEDDKISVTMKREDKEVKHTATIKKLTDSELVIETDKGKTVEFKKKK